MRNVNKTEKWLVVHNHFFDFEKHEPLPPLETQNYQLILLDDVYYTSECTITDHSQVFDFEITFVVYNKVSHYTDGHCIELQKNEVGISFRGETHAVLSRHTCRFQALAFNVHEDSPCYELFQKVREMYLPFDKRKLALPEIEPLLTQMLVDFNSENAPHRELLTDCCITNILIQLLRYPSKKEVAIIPQKEFLPNLTAFLDENFLNIESLREISEHFSYSYNYLCRIFKQQYNMTIQDYLIAKKMNHARRLLKEKKSVNEISEILGYSNPYNFSRTFKNYYGKSPHHYMQAEKNENEGDAEK